MNLSKVFAYDEQMIRVIGPAEAPLFVAADVCRALDIKQAGQAVENFSENEKGVYPIHTLGGEQEMLVVTEPGLYRLIFRSDKPAARKFQDWVFSDVLPQIRLTGNYDGNARLWQAYELAKTGRVQLEILRAIGVNKVPVMATGQPLDVAAFWAAAHKLASDKVALDRNWLRKFFRVERRAGNVLALAMNADFIQELKLPEYAGYQQRDFRSAFATMKGWETAGHKARFGSAGSLVAMSCWLWLLPEDANADLVAIAKLGLPC